MNTGSKKDLCFHFVTICGITKVHTECQNIHMPHLLQVLLEFNWFIDVLLCIKHMS